MVARVPAILVAGAAAVVSGCGGGELSLEGYSAQERRAIEQTQTILDTVYGLDVDEVSEVDRSEYGTVLTRVEVETAEGHLCLYFQDTPVGSLTPAPEGDRNGLYLLSIKRGPACAELVYNANG